MTDRNESSSSDSSRKGPMLDQSFVWRQALLASAANEHLPAQGVESIDSPALREFVQIIQVWRVIAKADNDQRVSDDAVMSARTLEGIWSEKLQSLMTEPVGIADLSRRLGIKAPSLDQALQMLNDEGTAAEKQGQPPSPRFP